MLVFPSIVKAGSIGAQQGYGALFAHDRAIGYYKSVSASYSVPKQVQKFGYALFFMSEYIKLIAMNAIAVTLFLGGWRFPGLRPLAEYVTANFGAGWGNAVFGPPGPSSIALEVWHDSDYPITVSFASLTVRGLSVPWPWIAT